MAAKKTNQAPVVRNVDEVCSELVTAQRRRTSLIRTRVRINNAMIMSVAEFLGYHGSMSPCERADYIKQATDHCKQVMKGSLSSQMSGTIEYCHQSMQGFEDLEVIITKGMVDLAKHLPCYNWSQEKDQRGFGAASLAVVIGETGNLSLYPNFRHVWKRLGLAPYEYKGRTLMGSTWKSTKPSLPGEEWTKFGYSPRRRSVSYIISENLVKLNIITQDYKDDTGAKRKKTAEDPIIVLWKGPYRQKYEEAKQQARLNHPEWVKCEKCNGTKKDKAGKKCDGCLGKGEKMKRCDLHGRLLAVKLLIKHLWCNWRDGVK